MKQFCPLILCGTTHSINTSAPPPSRPRNRFPMNEGEGAEKLVNVLLSHFRIKTTSWRGHAARKSFANYRAPTHIDTERGRKNNTAFLFEYETKK